MATKQAAILVLADGTCYRGYQEVMTDPSYRGQIVTFTCPELGNTGKLRSHGAMNGAINSNISTKILSC